MGYICFEYQIKSESVNVLNILNEIENGVVFSQFYDKEIATPVKGRAFTDYSCGDNSELIVRIPDDFFSEETLLTKIWNSFVLNICEYSDVKLEKIDINHSDWSVPKLIKKNKFLPNADHQLLLGTIIKPYYGMTLNQKISWIEKFYDYGFFVFKEDETYCVSSEFLLNEVAVINNYFQGKIIYIPNVTHIVANPKMVSNIFNLGSKICLINFLTVGFQNVSNLSKVTPGFYWGHRISYSNFETIITMNALSILAVLSGLTFLHIGSPTTTLEIQEKIRLVNSLSILNPNFYPVFTKLTPHLFRDILVQFKNRAVYLACGYFYNKSGEIDWNKVNDFIKVSHDK